jgi:predicted nucleic acid-binding protein
MYLREPHSDTVKKWVQAAEIVATCRIAYTEVISALDLRFKKKDLTKAEYELAIKNFSSDWAHFAKTDFDEFDAGMMLKKYNLNRFGAIHLSAAKLLKAEYQILLKSKLPAKRQHDFLLFFSSTDIRLCNAASSEGLTVLPLH